MNRAWQAAFRDHVFRSTEAYELPSLCLVEQRREARRLDDVLGAVRAEVRQVLEGRAGNGEEIAVGVGSRGIPGIRGIVEVVLAELKQAEFAPFIVPAMGSHGGGTVEGQLELLESYGISERTLGVSVRATMETIVIGEVGGVSIHIDKNVAAAGQAFLVNRIKPHTDFRGPIESGLSKMSVLGLGKRSGAAAIHALGPTGLRDVMPAAARLVAERYLLGGLAVVENEFGEIATVAGLAAAEFAGPREEELLTLARELMPRLPFEQLDVLLIDRIGKDISGTCLDPNVVGRWLVDGVTDPDPPRARIIVARSLTPVSHGNALGIGLLDFATDELVDRVDLLKTYVNGMTAGWSALRRTRLPITLPTDREAVLAAVAACGRGPHEPLRFLWVVDTLHLRVTAASRALWTDIGNDDALELVGGVFPLPFDSEGRLAQLADLVRDSSQLDA